MLRSVQKNRLWKRGLNPRELRGRKKNPEWEGKDRRLEGTGETEVAKGAPKDEVG